MFTILSKSSSILFNLYRPDIPNLSCVRYLYCTRRTDKLRAIYSLSLFYRFVDSFFIYFSKPVNLVFDAWD
jgi:hypothetical protein